MSIQDEYDEETCLTAGELRSIGCDIEEKIPDCAWVPRWSMRMGNVAVGELEKGNSRALPDCTFEISFTEPFRWEQVKGTIDLGGEECQIDPREQMGE